MPCHDRGSATRPTNPVENRAHRADSRGPHSRVSCRTGKLDTLDRAPGLDDRLPNDEGSQKQRAANQVLLPIAVPAPGIVTDVLRKGRGRRHEYVLWRLRDRRRRDEQELVRRVAGGDQAQQESRQASGAEVRDREIPHVVEVHDEPGGQEGGKAELEQDGEDGGCEQGGRDRCPRVGQDGPIAERAFGRGRRVVGWGDGA